MFFCVGRERSVVSHEFFSRCALPEIRDGHAGCGTSGVIIPTASSRAPVRMFTSDVYVRPYHETFVSSSITRISTIFLHTTEGDEKNYKKDRTTCYIFLYNRPFVMKRMEGGGKVGN